MILFKYTKIYGAEYVSHLDVLRHLGRTFTRAGIKVGYSQGYHPHKLIYMSAPIGVGMKSLSEYCVVDTTESAETFKEKFNEYSPKGIKCLGAWETPKKVGVASDIVKAKYRIKGIKEFSIGEVLDKKSFIITDREGQEKDVRDLIYSVKREGEDLICVLGFGNGLRAEKFAAALKEKFGGGDIDITKEEALIADGTPFENILKNIWL